MTGQHLLLLLWTLWLVFALLSIGDLLGVILALVFGLLSLGLIATGLATWRGYVIAWLMVHVLVAAYRVTVLRGPPEEAQACGQGDMPATQQSNPVGPWLQALSDWAQSPRLQTIFGSVSLIGLLAVLYLRPTVPWKYRVDIPLMILLVCVIVVAEYVLLPVSWRVTRHQKRPRPAATKATNRNRIDVGNFLQQQVRDALAHSALESEPRVLFRASGEVETWAQSVEPTQSVFSVELLRITRLTMREERSVGVVSRAMGIKCMADRVVGITIEHKTVPISLEPCEKVTGAAETPGWELASARWVHAGRVDDNTAARTAADLGAGLDRILRHKTVRPVFSWNAPGSAAAVIGKDAETKQILHFCGIVAGIRAGKPVAVRACLWSLARDDLARSLAAGITRELGKIGLTRAPTPSSTPKQRDREPIGL